MSSASIKITQQGLGMAEADEALRTDAWWSPEPIPPLTCPSTVPPASVTRAARRYKTVSLEPFED